MEIRKILVLRRSEFLGNKKFPRKRCRPSKGLVIKKIPPAAECLRKKYRRNNRIRVGEPAYFFSSSIKKEGQSAADERAMNRQPAAPKTAKLPPPAPVPPLRRMAAPEKIPAMAGAVEGPKLVRTAYTVQLGELPPSTPSAVDGDDNIIE